MGLIRSTKQRDPLLHACSSQHQLGRNKLVEPMVLHSSMKGVRKTHSLNLQHKSSFETKLLTADEARRQSNNDPESPLLSLSQILVSPNRDVKRKKVTWGDESPGNSLSETFPAYSSSEYDRRAFYAPASTDDTQLGVGVLVVFVIFCVVSYLFLS
jgi:hypothetical protein